MKKSPYFFNASNVPFTPYFCLLVFGILVTVVLFVFSCLAHLALQNVKKDFRIFVTSLPKVTKNQKWDERNKCHPFLKISNLVIYKTSNIKLYLLLLTKRMALKLKSKALMVVLIHVHIIDFDFNTLKLN